MPFTFPSSPTVGQQSLQNGRYYQWTGTAWEVVAVPQGIASTNLTDSTVAGRAILTAADAATQRTTLGLGTMATQASTSYVAKSGDTMTGQFVAVAGSASAPGVAVGTATNGLVQSASNAVGVATNGTERWQVASDGSITSVIPGGSTLLPQFQCRAWVNFNGTGTGTMTVRGSGNVSSVTRNAAGDYTINFTTAMPDANYAVTGSCGSVAAGVGWITDAGGGGGVLSNHAISSVRINTYGQSAIGDFTSVSIAIFR